MRTTREPIGQPMSPDAGKHAQSAVGLLKPEFIDETRDGQSQADGAAKATALAGHWQPGQTAIRALAALEAELPQEHRQPATLTILLTSDDRIQHLNNQFRGKDKPTNVLSFPNAAPGTGEDDCEDDYIGDIAIAVGVLAEEAATAGIALNDHFAHLVMHGTLHLLGYDHERGEAEARLMEQIEINALQRLGIANPYAWRPED